MPTTSPTPSAPEPVAHFFSTERSNTMHCPGGKPKIDYKNRAARRITQRMSGTTRRNKARRLNNLDMTPLRHTDYVFATFHYPEVHCFEIYAAVPQMPKDHWKALREWLEDNCPNPITGAAAFFWVLQYKWSQAPHRHLAIVIPESMEQKVIAKWREIVGHPASMADEDVVHFSRKDPETSSPEAAAVYVSKPCGHQEIVPTPWTAQGLNPPGWWGVIGMEMLPVASTEIRGEGNIRAAKERMRERSEQKIRTFRNPKTGEVCEDLKAPWNKDSPKGSSEFRMRGDGLLIHDEITRLFGGDPDLN